MVIKDLNLLKQITVKDFDHFIDRSSRFPEETETLMGKSLFSLKGQKWREMRVTLSPTFTGSKMRGIFVLMSDCANGVVDYLVNRSNGQFMEVEMKDLFSRYTNDVIATAAFGIKCDSLKNPDNTFYCMGKKLTDLAGILSILRSALALTAPKVLKVIYYFFFKKKNHISQLC